MSSSNRFNRPCRRAIVALAAAALPFTALGAAANAAPSPAAELAGDRQSPQVVAAAEATLDVLPTAATVVDSVESATPAELDAFDEALVETARITANEIGVDPVTLQDAWEETPRQHQIAVVVALTQLGAPYRSATSDPDRGFDCSGLTSYAWGQAGVELARPSGDQIRQAAPREPETAMAGDLVHFPGHVMISLGIPGYVVHSANHASDVELWVVSRSVTYGDPTE